MLIEAEAAKGRDEGGEESGLCQSLGKVGSARSRSWHQAC